MSDDDRNKDESAVDLMIHSYEICVRTGWQMMKLPLIMYSDLIDSWAKSVDAMVEDVRSKE